MKTNHMRQRPARRSVVAAMLLLSMMLTHLHLAWCCSMLLALVCSSSRHRWSEFLDEVGPLVASGQIHFEETQVDGFDKLPEALQGLFKGVNIGKVSTQRTGYSCGDEQDS